MDVARDGPRDAPALLVDQQRLPRRRGLLRLGRAGRPARRCRLAPAPRTTPASPCSTSTASIPGASRGGGGRRTRTSTSTATSATSPVEAPRNAAYDEIAALIVPARLAAGRGDGATRPPRFVAERGAKALAGGHLRRPVPPPEGLFYGGDAPDLEPGDAAPGAARPRRALQPARLDRPAHRPRPERPRRAHLRLPRRRRGATPAPRPGGASVTSIYDGSSTSALLTGMMFLAAYEECAAGRVHRHRARVRHPAEPAR